MALIPGNLLGRVLAGGRWAGRRPDPPFLGSHEPNTNQRSVALSGDTSLARGAYLRDPPCFGLRRRDRSHRDGGRLRGREPCRGRCPGPRRQRSRATADESAVLRRAGRHPGGPDEVAHAGRVSSHRPEPGIELPDTPEISPDLAGRRRERLAVLPSETALQVVPDWVCEILSPSTRPHDLLIKKPYYARVGVPHHWLVDRAARTVSAYRLEAGRWLELGIYGDEREARVEPFDAVPIDVASFWP